MMAEVDREEDDARRSHSSNRRSMLMVDYWVWFELVRSAVDEPCVYGMDIGRQAGV